MARQFVEQIERFAESRQVDLIRFEKGVRKDDIAKAYLAQFEDEEGVLFIGKAQEKTSVFRTERRRSEEGASYPWLYRSTAMNGSSASSSGVALPLKPWTMASSPVMTRAGCSGSPMRWMSSRSRRYSVNGWAVCHIRFQRNIAPEITVTNSRYCRPSLH